MTMVGRAEIDRRLGYHPANDPARVAVFELIRQQCTELAVLLDEVLPPGRELAEALTCVQTAQMYAIAAVACHQGEFEAPVQTREASSVSPTCPHRVQYVGDPFGSRGVWLECSLPDGHDERVHRTVGGSTFQ